MNISVKGRRRVVQAGAIIVLILPLFLSNMVWLGTYISADFGGLALTDPLTALEISAAGRSLWWPLILSAIPLIIMAAFLGRVFCSFICPLNFLLEVLPKRKKIKSQQKWQPILFIFFVIILSALVQLPVFNMLSPIYILMRMILFGLGIEAVILLVVLFGEWVYGHKVWCRKICPLGALYGVIGIKRCITIGVDEAKCIHCGKCSIACSMGVTPGSAEFMDKVTCTNCGDCIDVCQEKATYYSVCSKQKKEGR